MRGERGLGGALEALEFSLLVGGEAWGGGGVLDKGGGVADGVGEGAPGGLGEGVEGEERAEEAGHFDCDF